MSLSTIQNCCDFVNFENTKFQIFSTNYYSLSSVLRDGNQKKLVASVATFRVLGRFCMCECRNGECKWRLRSSECVISPRKSQTLKNFQWKCPCFQGQGIPKNLPNLLWNVTQDKLENFLEFTHLSGSKAEAILARNSPCFFNKWRFCVSRHFPVLYFSPKMIPKSLLPSKFLRKFLTKKNCFFYYYILF